MDWMLITTGTYNGVDLLDMRHVHVDMRHMALLTVSQVFEKKSVG